MHVINPDLPDEFKYETDYRKIPQHLLNKNIPQGRGMIKWQPMATTPTLYKDIQQQIENQDKVDKPILSEDQQTELDILLASCVNRISSVTIHYFEDGYINEYECIIERIDYVHKKVEVYLCYLKERKFLNVDCIVSMYR
ncbi:YolD-like family protein [Macrococcus hajekii]|uniref:YolD-like family protein n=1 Tax=Macrococcus hajekii TaxID=198482 RepID=A0A4R6BP62_9STAP|nr:YolD-like family protein [Macrococcus hajekii]TDM03522.1 YolD-like family protein [Macrococcus hajekii]GGA99515.1 hypothetical protein GCM10007190_04470 [Macrococcus hajekii]